MTESPGASYRADIQRPDGDGWVTVHADQHAWGTSPEEAGWSVLRFRWPVSVYDEDLNRFGRRRDGLRQAAGYRMVLTPSPHNRAGPREPVTFTLAELALAEVRRQAEQRRAARDRVAAARKALKDAQSRERVAASYLDAAKTEAGLLAVPAADVNRAARTARTTSTKGATT